MTPEPEANFARRAKATTALLRWLPALVWTALTVYVLLLPGEAPLLQGLAALLHDLGFTLGHAAAFGILAGLWRRALLAHLSRRAALASALGVAFIIALATEFGQISVSGRSATLTDVLADGLGALIATLWLHNPRLPGRYPESDSVVE